MIETLAGETGLNMTLTALVLYGFVDSFRVALRDLFQSDTSPSREVLMHLIRDPDGQLLPQWYSAGTEEFGRLCDALFKHMEVEIRKHFKTTE